MKTVWVLMGLGLLTFALFACGAAARTESAPPPTRPVHAPPVHVDVVPNLVDRETLGQGLDDYIQREGRPLQHEEVRLLIHTGKLGPAAEQAEVLEYTLYSRAGPRKHLQVKKRSPGIN